MNDNYFESKNPYLKANFLSKIYFCWISPLISLGRKKPLEQEDSYEILPNHKSEYLTDRLENEWKKELKKNSPSLANALFCIYFKKVLCISIISLIEEALRVVQPLLVAYLIQYFNGKIDFKSAVITGFFMFLITFINNTLHHPFFFTMEQYAMETRVAINGLVYRKTLKISSSHKTEANSSGRLLNILSNDSYKVETSFIFLPYLLVSPLQAIAMIIIMINMIDITILGGLFTLGTVLLVQVALGKSLNNFRMKTSKITDERINLTTEILNGIKIIKMYCWEEPFKKLIENIRKRELRSQAMVFLISAIYAAVDMDLPPVMTFSSVAFFIYISTKPLFPSYIVFIIAYYARLCSSVGFFFIKEIAFLITARVSIKRIESYLLQPEYKPEIQNVIKGDATKVVVKNLYANWTDKSNVFCLKNISFKVQSNELFAIVGTIGAGKSSLLMALLNEMPSRKGDIRLNGSVFYVSQEPWIFSGTIRENILFGKRYEKEKFNEIVKVTALAEDLSEFKDGEDTMIGDRGINLSGGQKARVSLARALYNDPDIYLFDDPLSAVDAHVGKHLFEKCINGYLKSKIRILVTHQVHHLTNVNQIMVLNKGEIKAIGTYDELLSRSELNFTNLLENIAENEKVSTGSFIRRKRKTSQSSNEAFPSQSINLDKEPEISKVQELDDNESFEEMKETGVLKCSGFLDILKYRLGIVIPIVIVLLFMTAMLIMNSNDYWLSYWANCEETEVLSHERMVKEVEFCLSNSTSSSIDCNYYNTKNFTIPTREVYKNRQTFFKISSVIIVCGMIALIIRSITFYTFSILASRYSHYKMLDFVMHKKMRFFDTNPVGRIMNRFSKDISNLDDLLPTTFYDFLQCSMLVFGTLVVTLFVNYWIIIPTIPVLALFIFIRVYFISSSRELKRIEGITRSPVYVHVNNTYNGLGTIRSCQNQDIAREEFDRHSDNHTKAFFSFLSATMWFVVRLDAVNTVFTSIVIYGCIFAKEYVNLTSGKVGLVLAYLVNLVGLFQWTMRESAEVENLATSVERIADYSKEKEEKVTEGYKKPPENWPQYGEIIFDNVCFSYAKNLPNVLKNITLKINPGEKVGVCGRTGAGKSSFFQALFRTAEVTGSIRIDGIDTNDVSLHDLRSNISIIPQEPTLFYGTLRYNLDPFKKYHDDDIWDALESVQLKELIAHLPGKLECAIEKNGANFSVGQKQLFCLARAILKKSKILIIDEATANVDFRTDHLIQKAIRSCFEDCTVITIAHRLQTIMKSDKILCLSNGEAVNFGNPYTLLQDPTSLLYKLAKRLGENEFARMFNTAKHHVLDSKIKVKEESRENSTNNVSMDGINVDNQSDDVFLS